MSTTCCNAATASAVQGSCVPANVPTPLPLIDSFSTYDATNGPGTPPNPVTPWNKDAPPASLLPPPPSFAVGLYQAWLATHPV